MKDCLVHLCIFMCPAVQHSIHTSVKHKNQLSILNYSFGHFFTISRFLLDLVKVLFRIFSTAWLNQMSRAPIHFLLKPMHLMK